MNFRPAACGAAFVSTLFISQAALAQTWPSKPIKVTTVAAGSALDIVLRTIGSGITGQLGQPIVVENRATTTHPEDGVARAPADGYSLGYFANAVWIAPYLRANLPYEPLRDFAPISLAVVSPNVVTVNASVPVNSVAELVAYAKARPGELNCYMSSGGGSPSLTALLFQSATGAKFTNISYKSTPQGLNDLMSGRLHVIFASYGTLVPQLKSGKLKMLAVTSQGRSSQTPDLPPMMSLGYPDFVSVSAHALLAPGKTPAEYVNRINREVVGFLGQADVKAKLTSLGFDVTATSPADLGNFMKSEIARMGPVMREAGIKPGDGE